MPERGALRAKEAARYLGVGINTFRALPIRRTYLPGRGRGRILVFRVEDLDTFLAQHREPKEQAS